MPLPITEVFANLPDSRRDTANKRHGLTDILTLAVRALISEAETWVAIADYGQPREPAARGTTPSPSARQAAITCSA